MDIVGEIDCISNNWFYLKVDMSEDFPYKEIVYEVAFNNVQILDVLKKKEV